MGFLSMPKFRWSEKDEVETSTPEHNVNPTVVDEESTPDEKYSNVEDRELSPNVQEGIHKVEAVASVWTKNDLIIAYIGFV